ncbi:MAG: hypothetical protein FWE11_05920 [Defluviitaleaceae bacterium]|nr:hypothetical protein [Defluviitaleaceae bacterium]
MTKSDIERFMKKTKSRASTSITNTFNASELQTMYMALEFLVRETTLSGMIMSSDTTLREATWKILKNARTSLDKISKVLEINNIHH